MDTARESQQAGQLTFFMCLSLEYVSDLTCLFLISLVSCPIVAVCTAALFSWGGFRFATILRSVAKPLKPRRWQISTTAGRTEVN